MTRTTTKVSGYAAALVALALFTACLPNPPVAAGQPATPPQAQPTPAAAATAVVLPATYTPPAPATDAPNQPIVATQAILPTHIGEGGFAPNINPLTGLPVADPRLLERRPLMVKVSNFPREGRPHAGLSFADMVFEYYIGWIYGGNRFLAIYYGQDAPKVGPIRSGRLVDRQLVSMYHGILAYGGADDRVDPDLETELGKYAISSKTSSCPPICRLDDNTVYSTFTDTTSLSQYATQRGLENGRQNLTGLHFDPAIPQGESGLQFGAQYASYIRSEWLYNPETGKYLRWSEKNDQLEMEGLVDRLTGQQIAFDNLIVLFAFHIEYKLSLHDIELWNNTRGGRAVFFRNGQIVEGVWRSAGHERPLQFLNKDLSPYALKPGTTWTVLAGIGSTFNQVAPGRWNLMFDLP